MTFYSMHRLVEHVDNVNRMKSVILKEVEVSHMPLTLSGIFTMHFSSILPNTINGQKNKELQT